MLNLKEPTRLRVGSPLLTALLRQLRQPLRGRCSLMLYLRA
jgi:hypothetical protein